MPAKPSRLSKEPSIGVSVLRRVVVAIVLGFVATTCAFAHHSIAGQFDMTKTLRLTGVVTKVEWTNPHVYLFLDAKGAEGTSATWKLETLPVAMLRKAGIKKEMLVTADVVNMDICPARNGTDHLGFILNIQFTDGRKFQFSKDPNGGATAVP